MKIKSNDFDHIEAGIESGFIRTFRTKKDASSAASEFGWGGSVVRVARRFETVWIVGKVDMQPDEAFGIEWDVLRVPALRHENGEQPVLRCRRLRLEQAA